MRVGINWGTLCHLFLYGIREKGAGEAGGCRNLAVSQICYSCGLGTLAPNPCTSYCSLSNANPRA